MPRRGSPPTGVADAPTRPGSTGSPTRSRGVIDAKSPYTARHSDRASPARGRASARALGLRRRRAARPAPRRAAARHRQARGLQPDPRQARRGSTATSSPRSASTRAHTQRILERVAVLRGHRRDRRRAPRAARRQRLPPRPGRRRPLAAGARARGRRRLRGADRRPALPRGDGPPGRRWRSSRRRGDGAVPDGGRRARACRGGGRAVARRSTLGRMSLLLAPLLLAAAAAPLPPAEAPQPAIVQRRIPFGARRKQEMAAYAQRHYGLRHLPAARPAGDRRALHGERDLPATLQHVRRRRAGPELHELPGHLRALRDRHATARSTSSSRSIIVPPHGRAQLDGDRDRARRVRATRRSSTTPRSCAPRCG